MFATVELLQVLIVSLDEGWEYIGFEITKKSIMALSIGPSGFGMPKQLKGNH